jgi:hypothetical protein
MVSLILNFKVAVGVRSPCCMPDLTHGIWDDWGNLINKCYLRQECVMEYEPGLCLLVFGNLHEQ